MRASSFHNLTLWQEHEESLGPAPLGSPRGDSAGAAGKPDDGGSGQGGPRPRRAIQFIKTRSTSMKLMQSIAPGLVNSTGSALSLAGVAAATAIGVGACHAIRLMIREAMEALPRAIAINPFLGARPSASALLRARTFELYVLSLLHHGAWVGLALRRCLQRHGWSHDPGGSTRALVLSAGYHFYVLLSLNSIWTHPLVTLQQIGEARVAPRPSPQHPAPARRRTRARPSEALPRRALAGALSPDVTPSPP